MFRRFTSHSQPAAETETIKLKLEPFGAYGHNPVKDEIAALRKRRDAGHLTDADYVTKVAELIGTSETGDLQSFDSAG